MSRSYLFLLFLHTATSSARSIKCENLQNNNSDVFAPIFLSTFDGFCVLWLTFRLYIKHYPGKAAVSYKVWLISARNAAVSRSQIAGAESAKEII